LPSRARYQRDFESQTDFAFALALIRMGTADALTRCLVLEQRLRPDLTELKEAVAPIAAIAAA
jgi:hypothetical protein